MNAPSSQQQPLSQLHPLPHGASPAPKRSILTIVAEVAVLVLAAVVSFRVVSDVVRTPQPPPPVRVGGMAWASYANNNLAHFAFTNRTSDVRIACVKGIVTAKESKIAIESQVVCTGEMKPNTTVSLDASWPKGNPDDICNKDTTFGRTLDWSKCEFTHVEVPPVLEAAANR